MYFNKSAYVTKILDCFGIYEFKFLNCPMTAPSKDLYKVDNELAGNVPYLMLGSRPDLTFAIGKLSQFCENAGNRHWTAAYHVLRYIKAIKDHGIVCKSTENLEVDGYCDFYYAGELKYMNSPSGFVILLAGGAVL